MKERLDVLLCNMGLAPSREKAKAIIMSGQVYVNGQKEDKAGSMFDIYSPIEVKGNVLPYVSRGGLKLEKSINNFHISLNEKVCMDVGASTGGFTDCMLQNNAKKVFAVDVGHGQLAWKLRQDERVVCMEKTNIRYVTKEDIKEEIDFTSIDVSFISLTKVLEPVKQLLSERGQVVCLIKPQFEAEKVIEYATSIGFSVLNLDYSPIKGPEGNIEYLLYLQNNPTEEEKHMEHINVSILVEKSHESL